MSKDKPSKHRSKKRHHDDPASSSRKKRQRQEPSSAPTSQQNGADDSSLYHLQTMSLYLPVPPIAQTYPAEGLCTEFLSPLLLTYYPPLDGIVLSYTNVRLSETADTDNQAVDSRPVLAKAVDAFAVAFVWLTADFLVFRPEKNSEIKAFVHFQSPSQLSLVFLNLISVTIRAAHMPRRWEWVQDSSAEDGEAEARSKKARNKDDVDGSQGYFVDEDGTKVEGFITARIIDFEIVTTKAERRHGLLKIEATLVSDEEALEAETRPVETRLIETGSREKDPKTSPTKVAKSKPKKGILRHSQLESSQDL